MPAQQARQIRRAVGIEGHEFAVHQRLGGQTAELLDFAKLMEAFEQYHVAFVSVTQHFHSGTSMGRLVLNVLLSFAVECVCQGYLRWQHCKHADTIAALVASGQL
jgi:hypothetical protein